MTRLIWVGAVAFTAFIGAVIVAANTGFQHPGGILVRRLPYGDKVGHLVLFGGLALAINLALGCRSFRLGRASVLVGSTLVVLFVVVEELSQAFLPTRSLDATDLAADFVGIAIASVLAPRLLALIIPGVRPSP